MQKQRKILSHKVYDHEKWPLFTFQMIESPNSRILMVSLDLMVCDGDSMQILFTEIADTLEGKSDAEKIEYSYAEYIQNISNQKNSESYEEDKAYWLNKIDSLSSYPQIPMKMKLADCRDYNIVRKSAIIDSVLWGNFKETARRHKVSPSALLCTLYGRIMAKWGNQSEVLLNLTVFQRQQKNTEKIIGDFTKLLPLNLVFAKEDIWKSAERVQEQIMKELDHLSFDGTEIMRELAKRRGVFGKALLPVVFTCVLFDCPENYFERLGSIKYAVSQTPQVFLDNQITEMGGRLHISWDVVDELFEACIIDEIFLEFVEDIKRISENNKANSTSLLNKNTILFVHGAYHAAWCWEEHFIPFFYAHGYNVYAMSFRNHGNSERIENVDQIVVKDMVEDLIKTIDIIDGKIILIAHSLGCRIAQMCLEEIYSSIQSVVLITPMPVRNNFLQLLQMSKKQRKNNLEYILFSERLDSEQKEYYMSLLDKESKKVEYAMMKRQKKFSIYVRKIPTLVIGSYNDQCVILQAVKDNAKIHTAELKIVDSVCHDMMLDPDWRNIADLIFKFIEKTIDKKSGDNYNDNYVSTQAHQGGE